MNVRHMHAARSLPFRNLQYSTLPEPLALDVILFCLRKAARTERYLFKAPTFPIKKPRNRRARGWENKISS